MNSLAKRQCNDGIIDIFGPRTFGQIFPSVFENFDLLFGATSNLTTDLSFSTEMVENDENFVLQAELPGVDREDIDITFDNGILQISCERASSDENEGEKTHWRERSYGKFERSCRVPNVDPEHINAELKQGILTVTLGKKEAAAPPAPKQIEIKTE